MNVDLYMSKRREAGLSNEDIAAEIGVGRNTPGRWVNGSEPKLAPAQRLAAFLNVSVEEVWPLETDQP
jgi:DNA-binding XRE family transcriptional regulator